MPSKEPPPDWRLPRRDYVLLPATVLVTVLLLTFLAEVGARLVWPEQPVDTCETWDEKLNVHVHPNCRSTVKSAEGDWVEYRYNECGFRSAASCGPKPPNATRIVVLGTSVSRGYWMAYNDSFSGRLERELSSACGRPVEFQNLSIGVAKGPVWHTAAQRSAETLSLEPDAIVLVVTNFDLIQYHTSVPAAAGQVQPQRGLVDRLGEWKARFTSDSRAMTMAMHFAFSDPVRYLQFFLRHGDSADFLRSPLTAEWLERLNMVDRTVGSLADAAHAAGVPLLLLLAPSRPAVIAAHASALGQSAGTDVTAFPGALAAIARQHGMVFVDPTSIEIAAPDWNQLFFFSDGHPTASGHRFIADALRGALLENVPRLADCSDVRGIREATPGNRNSAK